MPSARAAADPGEPGAPPTVDFGAAAAAQQVDPIQAQYGATAPLIQEPPVAAPTPAPVEVGARPGGSKWPRAVALSYLGQQPKLPVYVPLSRDEEGKPGRFYQSVIWNGWELPVPKGRTVFVPAPIAEIVNQSLESKRTAQARNDRSIDMMLITSDNPGGLLVEEYSDPVAVELIRRGAPLRLD